MLGVVAVVDNVEGVDDDEEEVVGVLFFGTALAPPVS